MRNEIDRANELYVLALRQRSNITYHIDIFFHYDDNNTSSDIRRLNESI